MSLEQPRSPRRPLLVVALLTLAFGASAGCEDESASTETAGNSRTVGSFHIVGDGMYEGFQRWRTTATPEDRKVIEELIGRKDLLIHVFLGMGRLSDQVSRGGASGVASNPDTKGVCDFHPIVGRFRPDRNWDVVYDRQRTDAFEEQYGIPTPVEVVLQPDLRTRPSRVEEPPAPRNTSEEYPPQNSERV